MQTATTRRHFSPSAIALTLVIALTAAILFVIGAQSFAPIAKPIHAPNASAEQDLRMVMQELERERLDQRNTKASLVAPRTTNTAEQDLRMVMQELERERLDQLNASLRPSQFGVVRTFDQSSIPCDPRPGCDR